jgi:hypothetical protein
MNVHKIANVTPLDRERLVRPILEGRGPATVWRPLAKERLSFKKAFVPAKQDRPDVARRGRDGSSIRVNASVNWSTASPNPTAPTSSRPPDTLLNDRKPL